MSLKNSIFYNCESFIRVALVSQFQSFWQSSFFIEWVFGEFPSLIHLIEKGMTTRGR